MGRAVARGALLLASVGVSLVLFEVLLQVLARLGLIASFSSMYADTVPDAVLGHRLPSRIYAEIDSRGFRNPEAFERVDIVALGDSQTYGYNAGSTESWPKRLEALSGFRVYNMGVGGYGPAQYAALLDDALALSPRHIVIGLYLGNDLVDACRVFGMPYWRRLSEELDLDVSDCKTGQGPVDARTGFRISSRYSETLMLLKQLPVLRRWLLVRRDLEIARVRPHDYYAVDNDPLRTVISMRRYDAVREDSPEVRRGRELTWYFLSSILDRIGDAQLTVLLIPTKANVLFEYLLDRGHDLPETFHALVADERVVTVDLAARLEGRGALVVDPRPSLWQAVRDRELVFLDYVDGHPTAVGYDRMARVLQRRVFGGGS